MKQASRQYYYVLSSIKQLKKARKSKLTRRQQQNEQAKFRKDPWQYAKDLFHPPSAGQPTFTVDQATEYFGGLYKDGKRNVTYEALPEWMRPPKPKASFNLPSPSLKHLQDAVAKKRNKNAPGLNSITFLVYKKCPGVLRYLLKIMERVWKTCEIPRSWQCALVVLLSKSDVLDQPSEFRPIALLNAEGRLFFTLMQWRLSSYMLENGYIDTTIQKGFMKDIAGCIEHSETMYQVLRDAKDNKRDICVSWIDLANAYGSVKHSQVQFSLEWYHVPSHFCSIIFNYYEGLMAAVMMKQQCTPWFRFEIGVFQGCTASTILFNVAFNTCFTHLAQLRDECGYQFTKADVKLLTTGYADDLGMSTQPTTHEGVYRSANENNQRVTDSLNEWLEWSKTMAAKPKKCVAMSLVKGKPVEPNLTIKCKGKAEPMARISDEAYGGSCRDPWFKFLGRFLLENLSEQQAKKVLLTMVQDAEARLGGTALRGTQKTWIWDSYVMSSISWLLMIHNMAPTFVADLQAIQTRCFKAWLGYTKTGNNSIFYRSKAHCGLQLKEMMSWNKQNRLIRRHILSTSSDPQVQAIHKMVSAKQNSSNTNEWKDCKELESLKQVFMFETMRGPLRQASVGVGWGHRRQQAQSTVKEERAAILRIFKEQTEESRMAEVLTRLTATGEWIHWHESVLQLDARWHSLIACESDYQLRFWMCAIEDVLPTPSMRHRWGMQADKTCPLGCGKVGSLCHILAGCWRALDEKPQSRITWRHDSVLLAIYRATLAVVNRFKNEQAQAKQKPKGSPKRVILFKGGHYEGQQPKSHGEAESVSFQAPRAPEVKSVLAKASDWKIQFDLEAPGMRQNSRVFPPDVIQTTLRPDGLIWSTSSKTMVWIELTSPWEANAPEWHVKKAEKYNQLKCDIEAKGWKVHDLYVEIGARGHVHRPYYSLCSVLGFTKAESRELKQVVEQVAKLCSHAIFVARYQRVWQERPLLDLFQKQ